MRKCNLVGSQEEHETGHVISHHANHTDCANKDPNNNAPFYLGSCVVLSGSSLFACIIH